MADQRAKPDRTGLPDRLIVRVRAVLAFERLWPIVVLGACGVGVFLCASWLGLWLVLPPWGRELGLLVFCLALAALASVVWRGVRLPDRAAALARLDRDSGLPHRPISAAEDGLANASADPATQALWDLHRKRLRGVLARVRVAPPSPRLADRDSYAVRAGVLVAVVAAAFVAGPEKYGRVAAAFAWQGSEATAGSRIDAWIDPPGYTGRPPLVILGAKTPAAGGDTEFTAPVNSAVVVRVAGAGSVEVTADGGLKIPPVKPGTPPTPIEGRSVDQRFVLAGDGRLHIAQGGAAARTFTIKATPDLPPRITLLGTPRPNLRGTMEVAYKIEDDYGVTGAEAHFANPVVRGRPVTGRALVEPPRGALALPALPGGLGEGKTTLDLSDHPWAGAVVTMTLTTRDEAGNGGESAPVTLTLPAKPFTKPLARALVEQRRDLVLDPDGRVGVATALDALQIAPDVFDVPPAIYLGLRTAQTRLAQARTDADLLGVADFLWDMALQIENGDLSRTEQDLRAAQKALRDALDRGASPDEIKKLTEALRQQMDKFLSELMQNRQRDQAENQGRQNDRNSRTVTQKDLKSLMDRMEDAAKNGDMAEAQRLLDQLNSLMENMTAAKRGNSQQSQATREMNRSMSDLSRMMKEQGDVRDKTFKESQGGDQGQPSQDGADDQAGSDQEADGGEQPSPQGSGKPGSDGQGSQGFNGLQRRQQALQGQLDDLQRRLRGLGMKGEQGFGDAQEAMKQAQEALGKGQGRQAVEAQGRALEGLQKGAGGLEQQMAQSGQQGQQGQRAEGEGGEQDGEDMQAGEDLDPLGRPRQGRGFSQSRDLDVSGGLAARAQQILQELRRRLGDPTRSQDEQDYLERLLKRY